MSDRVKLLQIIEAAIGARLMGVSMEEHLKEFESLCPGVEVRELCHSDLPGEVILDVALGSKNQREKLNHESFVALIKRMLTHEFPSEAESILSTMAFNANCSHPAGSDLVYDWPQFFPAHSTPPAEEIAALAVRDLNRDV